MKIAIQLYGHLRTFQITAPYLMKYFVNGNRDIADVKVFIHTWNELDAVQQPPHYKKNAKFMGRRLSDSDIEMIYQLYRPVACTIESQQVITEEDKEYISEEGEGDLELATGLKNAFYSFKSVNKLRNSYETEQGIKFDYVITTRPDILFFRGIDFSTIINKTCGWQFYENIHDVIFSPYVVGYNDVVSQNRYVSGLDLFMLGDSETMNKFIRYEYDLHEMFPMWTEKVLLYIMCKENIRHQFIIFEKDRCWTICRLNEKMKKKNDSLFSKFITIWYKIQIPLFLKSELYCRNTCLNVTTYKDKESLSVYINKMLS